MVLAVVACGSASGDDESAIQAACRKIAALPCADDSEAECVTDLEEQRAEPEMAACREEFDAFLSCIAEAPLVCEADMDFPSPAECGPARFEFTQCMAEDDPVICAAVPAFVSAEQPCATNCGDYAATCSGVGPFSCTCSSGPNAGASFAIDVCRDLLDVIAVECGE